MHMPTGPLSPGGSAVPRLGALRNRLPCGDIWERPLLSMPDRSLITVAVNAERLLTAAFGAYDV